MDGNYRSVCDSSRIRRPTPRQNYKFTYTEPPGPRRTPKPCPWSREPRCQPFAKKSTIMNGGKKKKKIHRKYNNNNIYECSENRIEKKKQNII